VLLATATGPDYVDISAEYGKTYEYSVQGFRGDVESDIAGPETITPVDKFPPEVPIGLNASVGLGSVELAWTRNTESDFKDYRIARSEEGGPFVEVARGLDAPAYSDHAVQTGKHYRYQISAADQAGNVSAPSAAVEITAP
jgi:fibronectin type 3 domain-containing protein